MTHKQKIYFWMAIFAALILALVLGGVMPLFFEIKHNSQKLALIKSKTTGLELENARINDFKKKYDGYKPTLDAVGNLFIDPKNPVDFIKFLENSAAIAGINPKISLVPKAPQDTGKTVAFQLFASDNFLNILEFAKQIEYGPYLVQINAISVKNSSTRPDEKNFPSANVDATFSINAFTQ